MTGLANIEILLGIFYFVSRTLPLSAADTCEGWFGSPPPLCVYKCRCTGDNCKDNGDCQQGSQCVKGWFGPQCQYNDLAYSSSFRSTPRWLYDADDGTCNPQRSSNVTLNLGSSYPFTWLRLYVNDTGVLQDFTVQFKNKSADSTILDCSNMKKATVDINTLDIHCDMSETVEQVILTGQGVKALCSVYVSGGRNVALKQNTKQSSKYGGDYYSSNAVDGNTNGNVTLGKSCTHTGAGDHSPTWTLRFFSPAQFINRYVLYNRDDNQHRLRGFILTSIGTEGTTEFQYQDASSRNRHVYEVTSVTPTSPISSVEVTATNDLVRLPILTLCEVELYGDSFCPLGKWGRQCEKLCNCAESDEKCFVSTGGCPSGCAIGFYGESCHLSCPSTYHGKGCTEKCSVNCVNQLCDSVTGSCDSCPAGKTGSFCEKGTGVDFAAFPESVAVGLTRNLKLRCSFNDTVDQSNNITMPVIGSITSVVVSKLGVEDQALAAATLNSAPISYVDVGHLEGYVESQPTISASLVLTWFRPGFEMGGVYECRVHAIDDIGFPVVYVSNLEVSVDNPTVERLVGRVWDLEAEDKNTRNRLDTLMVELAEMKSELTAAKSDLERLKEQNANMTSASTK